MNILSLLTESPVAAFAFLLAIIFALTVHEFAHAWTADKLGDDTPYLQGRVTLNPLAHLDPLGSLLFLLVGFGYGKPVQYNPNNLRNHGDELKIALAGPLSNLILAVIFKLLAVLQVATGVTVINGDILGLVAIINIYLAAFNMLPIPPLDGSSIIAHFWPEYRGMVGGQIGMLLLLILIFMPFPGGNLLQGIVGPINNAFDILTSLFGLLPRVLF
jgi:Zn-dependent protease